MVITNIMEIQDKLDEVLKKDEFIIGIHCPGIDARINAPVFMVFTDVGIIHKVTLHPNVPTKSITIKGKEGLTQEEFMELMHQEW